MALNWQAWRVGHGAFTLWHRVYDEKWTVCGREPSGIISRRQTPPSPETECRTCRWKDQRESQELRNR